MLDNSSKVNLYEQLKLAIKNDILNGIYKEGDRLPNEKQLCEQYGVSRITVRRAIKELAKEGLIEVKHGKGTFVSKEKLSIKILDLGGYAENLVSKNRSFLSKVLEKKLINADDHLCNIFKMKTKGSSKVLELTRLIIDEGEPLGIDIAYFPLNIYPGIYEKIHDNTSTFNLIQKDYGIVMAKAYKEFSVVTAQSDYSKLLDCTPSEPLFFIKKVIYDPHGIPVHYSLNYILASRVKYVINVDIPYEQGAEKKAITQ